MYVLIVFYLIVAAASAFESNWPRTFYWLGATIINCSILWAMK